MVSKMSNGFSTKKRVPVIWGAPWGRPCPERPQVKQHELETTEELESQGWLVHGCRGTNNDHLWWCVGVVCHSRRFVTSSSMTSTDFHIFRVRLLFCNQDLHRRLDGGKHIGLCEDGGNLDPSFQTNPSRTKCDRFLRLYPWNLKKMIRADESWWKQWILGSKFCMTLPYCSRRRLKLLGLILQVRWTGTWHCMNMMKGEQIELNIG